MAKGDEVKEKGPSEPFYDEFTPFLREQLRDPEFAFHYGRSSAWGDFREQRWWKRLWSNDLPTASENPFGKGSTDPGLEQL